MQEALNFLPFDIDISYKY